MFSTFHKLLKKLTGLDLQYLLRAGGWTFFKQASISLNVFILNLILSRFLSQSDFGLFNLVMATFATIGIFSLPGFQQATIQQVAKNFDGSLKKAIFYRFSASVIGSLILIGIGLFFINSQRDTTGVLLIYLSLLFPFYNSLNLYDYFLTGKKNFKLLSLFTFLQYTVTTLCLFISFQFKNSVYLVVLGFILIQTLFQAVFTLYCLNKTSNNKTEKFFFRYGLALTAVSAIGLVGYNLDKVLLGSFVSLDQLAIYSIALLLPDGISKNVRSFLTIFTVKLIPLSKIKKRKVIKFYYLRLIGLGILIALIAIISLPFVLTSFFSISYNQSIFYGQLLALSLVPLPMSATLAAVLTYEKSSKDILFSNITQNLSRIILYGILVPLVGILGVVWANLLSSIIVYITLHYLVFRNNKNE